ncbi:MAG TPA: hypothetical protein PK322_16255, partial [Opitutaceae bacterium]|nr:hypothetical protein [Opitutaceae bacterium]
QEDNFAAYLGAAFDPLAAYQSTGGYHYPTVWRGPSAEDLAEALSDYSIVFIAAHSRQNLMALTPNDITREQLRGGTAGESQPPHTDPENDIYYIEELPDSMDHCRFVFFHGCQTAAPNPGGGSSLPGAALARGADLAAGFLYAVDGWSDPVAEDAAVMFHTHFWGYALGGYDGSTLTVRGALDRARLDVELAYGSDHMDGVDSVRLYPVGADEDLKEVEWGD